MPPRHQPRIGATGVPDVESPEHSDRKDVPGDSELASRDVRAFSPRLGAVISAIGFIVAVTAPFSTYASASGSSGPSGASPDAARALHQAVSRTMAAHSWVVHQTSHHGGKHPYVAQSTVDYAGPSLFETDQSIGSSGPFVTIVIGNRVYRTADAVFPDQATARQKRLATRVLSGKYTEDYPVRRTMLSGLRQGRSPRTYPGLEFIQTKSKHLEVTESGRSFTFSAPAVHLHGTATVVGGFVVREQLDLPAAVSVYVFGRFNQPIRIGPPPPSAIVTRNPKTGCISAVTFVCVV